MLYKSVISRYSREQLRLDGQQQSAQLMVQIRPVCLFVLPVCRTESTGRLRADAPARAQRKHGTATERTNKNLWDSNNIVQR